jgi:hypothetical protein
MKNVKNTRGYEAGINTKRVASTLSRNAAKAIELILAVSSQFDDVDAGIEMEAEEACSAIRSFEKKVLNSLELLNEPADGV